jgi:hypothetical protein
MPITISCSVLATFNIMAGLLDRTAALPAPYRRDMLKQFAARSVQLNLRDAVHLSTLAQALPYQMPQPLDAKNGVRVLSIDTLTLDSQSAEKSAADLAYMTDVLLSDLQTNAQAPRADFVLIQNDPKQSSDDVYAKLERLAPALVNLLAKRGKTRDAIVFDAKASGVLFQGRVDVKRFMSVLPSFLVKHMKAHQRQAAALSLGDVHLRLFTTHADMYLGLLDVPIVRDIANATEVLVNQARILLIQA